MDPDEDTEPPTRKLEDDIDGHEADEGDAEHAVAPALQGGRVVIRGRPHLDLRLTFLWITLYNISFE